MNAFYAAVLALVVASSSFAGEMAFSFRGISLGDTDQVALSTLKKEFSTISPASVHPYRRFTAGDAVGVANDHCQAEAPARERLDCLWVQVSVLPDGVGIDRVRLIDVIQSFKVSIPQKAFIERITKTYGPPRSTHVPAKSPGIYRSGTYLWGGREALTKPFYMLDLPYADMLAFGDIFVLLQLSGSGTDVTGYQLRIADSEAFFQVGRTRAEKRRAEVERAKKETLDGLKF